MTDISIRPELSGSCSSPILGEICSAKFRPSELTATWIREIHQPRGSEAPNDWRTLEIQMLPVNDQHWLDNFTIKQIQESQEK